MAWVIDSCVLLDVALKDPAHGVSSALFLEQLRPDGLVVCPVSVVEIAPFFDGEVHYVRDFLKVMGVEANGVWMEADTEAAVRGWTRFVRLKRSGAACKRPLADILIGGFALRHQGLVTRNPGHFRPFFPRLTISEPEAVRGSSGTAATRRTPSTNKK
jgi:predicted nucleic acid-binding protein